MGFGLGPRRALVCAVTAFAVALGGAELTRAQIVCNVNYPASPPENLTNPGQPAAVGDVVRYSFDLSAGLIEPGNTVEVSSIDYSLSCDGGGFIIPGCADDGGSIQYAGDASILTDCPAALSTDNAAGGAIAFTLSFTPAVVLIEGNPGCNLMFNGNVTALGNDVTPLMTEGASGIPPGGGTCTDPGNGLNASGLNSFSVDLQADCPLQLEKCVAIDAAGDGFGNDPCLPNNTGLDGQDVEWRIVASTNGNGVPGNCVVTDPDLGFDSSGGGLFDIPLGGSQSFAIPGVCGDLTEGTNTATVECSLCAGLAFVNTAQDSAVLTCNPPMMMPATTPWGSALLAGLLLLAVSLFAVWRQPARA